MEVRGTNIFDQENIDWKTWTQALLWHQIVYHKNEFSGYELVNRLDLRERYPWPGLIQAHFDL